VEKAGSLAARVSREADAVLDAVRNAFPVVCAIVGIESEREGRHVGSAFRVSAGRKRLLVTAKHVIDEARSAPLGAGFVERRGEAPARLLDGPHAMSDAADLAVFVLEEVDDASPVLFRASLFDVDHAARSHDYLFVHGFPGERARFLFGESHHRSLPYGVMERDDDLPADTKPFEFAMDYDPKNISSDATLVMPPGLSGSPVWRVGAYRHKPEEWSPSASRLVGVVTRYNHDKRVLLATEISVLDELIQRLA